MPPSGPTLQAILAGRRLESREPCTKREIDCGISSAVYFFLGCAAFPEGAVAFLASAELLQREPASYSPFDTGSLDEYSHLADLLHPWSDPDKHAFLAAHLGEGADAVAFCAEYVATHFKQPVDYVQLPQHSEPDVPAYHGLVSTNGDRRTWSIEVQLHGDLELDDDHLEAIVLGQPDLFADLPDDLCGLAVVAEDEGSIVSTIKQLIIKEATA